MLTAKDQAVIDAETEICEALHRLQARTKRRVTGLHVTVFDRCITAEISMATARKSQARTSVGLVNKK